MKILIQLLFLPLLCGCTVVSGNRPSQDWQEDLQQAIDEKREEEGRKRFKEVEGLLATLATRDTQAVDLVVVGKNLVASLGSDRAWDIVLAAFSRLTDGQSPAKAGDMLWVQNQPRRVQDLSWMILFRTEWQNAKL